MIVAAVLLLLSPASAKPPCVAWRDPSSGKILDARGLQDRREAARRRMFDGLKERSSPIQETQATPACVRRAGEPMAGATPAPTPTPAG